MDSYLKAFTMTNVSATIIYYEVIFHEYLIRVELTTRNHMVCSPLLESTSDFRIIKGFSVPAKNLYAESQCQAFLLHLSTPHSHPQLQDETC